MVNSMENMHTDVRVSRGLWLEIILEFYDKRFYPHLSVLAEMATIPSGHCSEEKLDAYSNVSYDSGVRWNLDWYE